MSQNNVFEYYNKQANWSFDQYGIMSESLTEWDLIDLIKRFSTPGSRILDLGTAGGEKVISNYPVCAEILATDYSPEMIGTAKKNLEKSGRTDITFKVMDNLNMDVPDDHFDIVTARHTLTAPDQIIRCLKPGGHLLIRGVDKYDCHELKLVFGRGQGFDDPVPVSITDYEAVLRAGFADVELVPVHEREYYKDRETFLDFLRRVPILNICDEDRTIEEDLLDEYIKRNTFDGRIRLIRRCYGITARKPG